MRIKAGPPQVDVKGKPYTYAQEIEGDPEGAEVADSEDTGNPWSGQAYDWESMQEVDFC